MPITNSRRAKPTVTFLNRDGKLVGVPTVTASRLKNESGAVFDGATHAGGTD